MITSTNTNKTELDQHILNCFFTKTKVYKVFFNKFQSTTYIFFYRSKYLTFTDYGEECEYSVVPICEDTVKHWIFFPNLFGHRTQKEITGSSEYK